MAIKAIVMDCGGVIATEVQKLFLQEIAVKEDLDVDELIAVYRDLSTPLILGKSTEDDFWLSFIDRLGIERPLEVVTKEYKKLIRDLMVWDRQVLSYLKDVKKDHPDVKIVLLSNAVKEWVADFQKRHDLSKYFDQCFFSFDLQSKKPDQDVFDKVCQALQVKPEECIFVDNNDGNVQAASKLKLVAHKYESLNGFQRFIEANLK